MDWSRGEINISPENILVHGLVLGRYQHQSREYSRTETGPGEISKSVQKIFRYMDWSRGDINISPENILVQGLVQGRYQHQSREYSGTGTGPGERSISVQRILRYMAWSRGDINISPENIKVHGLVQGRYQHQSREYLGIGPGPGERSTSVQRIFRNKDWSREEINISPENIQGQGLVQRRDQHQSRGYSGTGTGPGEISTSVQRILRYMAWSRGEINTSPGNIQVHGLVQGRDQHQSREYSGTGTGPGERLISVQRIFRYMDWSLGDINISPENIQVRGLVTN
jgi:hypothetical protein